MFNDRKIPHYDVRKLGFDKCKGASLVIMCTVLNYMNANITVKMTGSVSSIDKHGQPRGSFADILSNTVHLTMLAFLLRNFDKSQLYPYFDTELKMISLNDSLSYADRFLLIFNWKIWIFLMISCSLSVVALKYILKSSVSEAFLDFSRMLVSS